MKKIIYCLIVCVNEEPLCFFAFVSLNGMDMYERERGGMERLQSASVDNSCILLNVARC